MIMTDKFKVVMGWNIGDYDFRACVRIEKDSVRPLYIHKSRDAQIERTAVTKTQNGRILIGGDALRQREYAIHFIRSPRCWNKISFNGITHKEYMSDFIRGISETILQNSSNQFVLRDVIIQNGQREKCWKKDEVMLVVSCPDSEEWKGEKIREQYEELISEITGILNVRVINESFATLFSLFHSINLEAGSLVLDLGPSEMKAVYVLPERKKIDIISEGWTCQIENAMLGYILKREKVREQLERAAQWYDKTKVLAVPDDHTFYQLKRDKEDYYDKRLTEEKECLGGCIRLSIIDEDGDVIYDDEEVAVFTTRCQVTDEMMQYAEDGYEFTITISNKDEFVNYGTWRQNFRCFLLDVEQTIVKENLPLELVAITGDSVWPFVIAAVRDMFPEQNVIFMEPMCTVKGLVKMDQKDYAAVNKMIL